MSRVCVFVLGLLLCLQVQAAALLASVDRARLNAGETLELTLQTRDVTQFGKPDLSPLQANFEVRDTRQVNSLNSLDDQNAAGTRWIITLLPRQSGSVEIPARNWASCAASRSACKSSRSKPAARITVRCSSMPASINPKSTCRPRRY